MFVKILVPNRNNKIELSVQELEALIEEAIRKDRLERPYWIGSTGWNSINCYSNNTISSSTPSISTNAIDEIVVKLDDLTTAKDYTTNGVNTI